MWDRAYDDAAGGRVNQNRMFCLLPIDAVCEGWLSRSYI